MDITRFHGVVPAMATPFKSNYELDLAKVAELIEGYIAAGVHGISVAGSQGEFFSLTVKEHLQLLEKAVEVTDARVPVYAGTGAVTTSQAIEFTKAAESIGADLALVITPYFAQPSQEELIEHYVAVAKATKLPVMLYNNPPRTSVNVLPKTLTRCMNSAENIVGIKDSAGDLTQSIEFQLLAPRGVFSRRHQRGHGACRPKCRSHSSAHHAPDKAGTRRGRGCGSTNCHVGFRGGRKCIDTDRLMRPAATGTQPKLFCLRPVNELHDSRLDIG
ncbi:dihydrodipicolinate synthase family protein [Pusillimonas sp.]|uniref:dihydrodipicolinate synthase family protein n=1 Tax=Pusillimonas sp. TaxID=3040095 RepID=UPI0037C8D123